MFELGVLGELAHQFLHLLGLRLVGDEDGVVGEDDDRVPEADDADGRAMAGAGSINVTGQGARRASCASSGAPRCSSTAT